LNQPTSQCEFRGKGGRTDHVPQVIWNAGGGAVTRETAVHIYDQLMLPIFKPWNWVWGGGDKNAVGRGGGKPIKQYQCKPF